MTKSPNLLRIQDVFRRVGFKRNKLYDLINAGAFPKPVKIGPISVWPEDEVDAWVRERIAERDAGASPVRRRSASPEPAPLNG
jgi:prophage regulatory protein